MSQIFYKAKKKKTSQLKVAANYQERIDKPLDSTSLCLEALGAAAAQFLGISWGCTMKPSVSCPEFSSVERNGGGMRVPICVYLICVYIRCVCAHACVCVCVNISFQWHKNEPE